MRRKSGYVGARSGGRKHLPEGRVYDTLHPNWLMSNFPGMTARNNDDLLDAIQRGADGKLDISRLIGIALRSSFDPMMRAYPHWVADLDPSSRPNPMTIMNALMQYNGGRIPYLRNGSTAYLMSREATDMLSATSLDGVPIDDFRLPYAGLYIGYDSDIRVTIQSESLVFDGAYAVDHGDEFQFIMALRPVVSTGHPVLDLRPPIAVRIPKIEGGNFASALLKSIDEGLYNIDGGDDFSTRAARAHQIGIELGVETCAVERSATQLEAARNSDQFEALVDLLGLVANSLLYITNPTGRLVEQAEYIGASQQAIYQLNAPTNKGRDRGRRMLEAEGAYPVRRIVMSPDLATELRNIEAHSGHGSPAIAYWRQGHWRRQAYGAGRSLRKLVWIEPTLCNAEAGVRARGSIYEVAKPAGRRELASREPQER